MPARLYARQHRGVALPLLLYLHGGGFTIGSIATHDMLCRELARLSGAMVVSLEYRLAPEHRFPTASNDAWDALAWLAQRCHAGRRPRPTGGGGDSAGGTWRQSTPSWRAMQACRWLCSCCLPRLRGAPGHSSHATYSRGLVLEEPTISWFFGHYVQNRAEREDWRFAPCTRPMSKAWPPAWIGLAECDPLVDEGVDYADKLRASSVAVDLKSTVA